MKNIKLISLLGLGMALVSSCNEYLDPNEYSILEKNQVYSVTTAVSHMSSSVYGCIPSPTGLGMSAASDECEEVDDNNSMQIFNTGNWNQYKNPDDTWSQCYSGIRMANDQLTETDTLTWSNWRYTNPTKYVELIRNLNTARAEDRFLSAYLYFELFKRYGEVPLITTKVPVSQSFDASQYPKAKLSDIVNYISEQCDIVCREGKWYLSPEEITLQTDSGRTLLKTPYRDTLTVYYPSAGDLAQYLGRATRASAYALKAKALVYYASPLFNPNNDVQRWKDAAVACKKVLDLPSKYYSLESQYSSIFNKKSSWSKEFLFARKDGASNSFETENYPISIEGGKTGACPSQNLVDAYEVLENNSKVARAFDWNSADSLKPYYHRDPRMASTIYVNGDKYNTSSINNLILDCSEGGNSAPPLYHATKTGYYLKKYINAGLDLKNGKADTKTWILMRLGDFYLYYAEAMNEAYGPDDDGGLGMTAREALNIIRKRAKMPNVTVTSQDEFREKVYHERQVELAFENHRWWDLRRWKKGTVLSEPLRGVSVRLENGKLVYKPTEVESRTFDENKMYLYPIPQSEIDKTNLVQNPNW